MACEIAAASVAARQVFARADEALGEPLGALIANGPEDALTLTANAQPAIVTASTAILAALRERYPTLPDPAFAAGHSLGEYSALVAAGALRFEDAVRVVRARGRAMQQAVAPGVGAMAAIMGIEPSRIEDICREAAQGQVVSPANFNAPGQVAIAGDAAAVARAAELVEAAGGKAIPLKVSAPFHCALMAPAARVVADELARVELQSVRFPVVANYDAAPNADVARVKELLVRQVDNPVRWEASVRAMHEAGVTHALEIGPGKVLAGLVKRVARAIKVLSVGDAAGLAEAGAFLGL